MDVPAVDKEVLHGAGAPGALRLGDVPFCPDKAPPLPQRDQGRGKFLPIHRVDGREKVPVARGGQFQLPFPQVAERDPGVGEGHPVHYVGDPHPFRAVFFEEFHPGGGVVKDVPDHQRGPHRAAGVQ